MIFNTMNYREYAPVLKKELLDYINENPCSILSICKKGGIDYKVLLNFYHGRSQYMNFENMSKLRACIKKGE